MAVAPNITYTITCNKPSLEGSQIVPIPLNSTVRMSYASGYNKIYFIFNSDISLSRYEIRITGAEDEYGVGIGKLAYYLTGSIAANTNHACTVEVNSDNFYLGDITYRVSMYAQNAVDLTWDATNILLTAQGLNIADSEGNLLEVYVQGNDNAIVERTSADTLTAQNFTSATLSSGNLSIG